MLQILIQWVLRSNKEGAHDLMFDVISILSSSEWWSWFIVPLASDAGTIKKSSD